MRIGVTKFFCLLYFFLVIFDVAYATDDKGYIRFKKEKNYFVIAEKGNCVPLFISNQDFPGVLKAFRNLRTDLKAVTGIEPSLTENNPVNGSMILVAGTLGKNSFIDELVASKKLNVSNIIGKWEGFLITVVEKPKTGIDRAMIIVGSDKRGTIFGIYDLLQEVGVSPWSWWADVPVKRHPDIYFVNQPQEKIPAVKYRGIFINDEQPSLGGWVAQNYGGFNHKFYEKVFELILRLKGNFLWPAMWGQSFYSDDPLSPKLADEYGVVIGTSHHEPMMRAHVEWQRNGGGKWNYSANEKNLQQFWKEGITRMGSNESIITLAMRGDGDEPMSEESNVKLLQRIVDDQRKIIEETTGKPASEFPQVWALYKEVQDYYDKGMRVPEDVTLLLCDDNWGNIRKLPSLSEKHHPGGYGIYYHFDYVGGPRNYKWINTNPIAKVWEQMNLAWEFGAKEIWIVNVGDIKPMEFPIEFFLNYAFDPGLKENGLQEYTERWATREFGDEYGKDIARIISLYTKYNGRRKPELLAPDNFSPELYSLVNYKEAETVVNDYNKVAQDAERIYGQLPKEYKDAFYQLVLYPTKASANINELYFTIRLNHLYAEQGRIKTNELEKKAKDLFDKDAELAKYYNETMSRGKWNHMMDQKRLGYKGWHDDFKENNISELKSVSPDKLNVLGISIEGSEQWWPASKDSALLPAINSLQKQSRYIEIFNRGSLPFDYSIQSSQRWIVFKESKGSINDEKRIEVSINWKAVPVGKHKVALTVKASSKEEGTVYLEVNNFPPGSMAEMKGFVESNGFISIEAEHFSRAIGANGLQWKILPDHGRSLSAITTVPAATPSTQISAGSPHVEYDVYVLSPGKIKIHAYVSPSIDFTAGNGLEYAVSIDEQEPVMVNIHGQGTNREWEESVKNNIRKVSSEHEIDKPGKHVVKFWRVDPGVVLQKMVIDMGGLRSSYLGPPESFIKK
jgi:hypothetical protein